MRSLRTKITIMTLLVVLITVLTLSVLCVFFVRNNERRRSDQILLLMLPATVLRMEPY